MGATAEARISKRRINELEGKLKKLQRDLLQLKVEKRKVKHLRKQTKRAMQVGADCSEILEYLDAFSDPNEETPQNTTKKKNVFLRCRNEECIAAGGFYKETGACDVIDAGIRLIVVCRDCGSRYTVAQ